MQQCKLFCRIVLLFCACFFRASLGFADTVAPEFTLTTTSDTTEFSFNISAAGTFYVDWGDGSGKTIEKLDTTDTTYTHDYTTPKTYTIKLTGQATEYNADTGIAAISFYVGSDDSAKETNVQKIASIGGSLGAIFKTLDTDTNNQPRFVQTFYKAANMKGSIPANLFAGISGAPANSMFYYTFYNCKNLTGSIPAKLFAGISGKPAGSMFNSTFSGCKGLSGSIPEELFKGIDGPPASRMFFYTFSSCENLSGPIPEKLFGNIYDKPAEYMFSGTFYGCKNLTGSIPEKLFGNIDGPAKFSMFSSTFVNCENLTGSIPEKLFGNIYDKPAGLMFNGTFSGCKNLTGSIPEKLFGDIGGEPATWMFASTFSGCKNLSGSIPAKLFKGIDGPPAELMFGNTFAGCENLTGSIPAGLFGTLKDAPASKMFHNTFKNCSNLTGEIPGDLFVNIDGAPASYMFAGTFEGCSRLTGSIPKNLFGTIYNDPAEAMFEATFKNCSNLTGEIPDGLFGNITNKPAKNMFAYTFNGCSNLSGPIPEGLFGNISDDPAIGMFSNTFSGCIGLIGEIPDGLFGTLKGAPAEDMFNSTFYNCSKLTSIPKNLFGEISGEAKSGMFSNVFNGCTFLTGPSAIGPSARNIDGEYLYQIWPNATKEQVGGAYSNDKQLDDYPCIPEVWGGPGRDCTFDEFQITTTPDTKEFSFNISAAGEFMINWGDGKFEVITKTDTTNKTYTRNYATANTYTIKLAGQATAYNADTGIAAISFYVNSSETKIASISGSLGAIFRTLEDGTQPRFFQTFYGCSKLESIPADLFKYISGAPVSSMFENTFAGCSKLESIPAGLFAGIKDAPAEYMFRSTFEDCSELKSIPEGLFKNISGAPAISMFENTFAGCSKLESIPAGLFAGIHDAPAEAMFAGTFSGCSELKSIPEGLFAGISGPPADWMFSGTFDGCSGLKSIPGNLFAGISGAPAEFMFAGTFSSCSKLESIPEGLFAGISGEAKMGMFSQMFQGCTSLTGPSARINGKYLYDIWDTATEEEVEWAYWEDTKLDDYPCIPEAWGGPGNDCTFNKFQVTTTDDTNMFGFVLGSAGEFIVDWGDGKIQYIKKSYTDLRSEYTHNYSVPGQYTVKMTGSATAYSTWLSAISFVPRENVYSMLGSLASIFGTLPNGTQPLFSGAFQGCSELIEIPDTLFDGLTGKPAERMFENTFSGCSSLTDLPSRLFDHFNGASPARSMFNGTFSGCTSLRKIPGDLFAGIYGSTAQELFRNTFSGCSSLTTVPGELFSMLRDAPSTLMFYETFSNCTSLTQIPENLFSSMSNKPATGLFQQTFSGCTSLTQIPAGLFANFSSTEQNMFNGTFQGCTSLTQIPVTLFENISGNAADNSFESTFWGSENIDKIISVGGSYTNWVPVEFFPKLESGANAFNIMFTDTALAQECPQHYTQSDVFWAPQILPKVVCVPDYDCPVGEYFDADRNECTTCEPGNICQGGVEPPASCSEITNGEYPMSDTGKSDISDCYKMCEFTSDICKVTTHSEKAYYGYQCTYDCETLWGTPCEIVDNTCKETECPNAYEYVDGECRPCQRENALSFADMPGCNPDVCASGFHPEVNGCYGDSIPCVAANAIQAHRQWDSVQNVYGLCTIIECADGYHIVDNVCLPNTEVCTLTNGIGIREWDFNKNEWGACIATTCDPGYTNDRSMTNELWLQCGRCNNAYSEEGDLAVSTYVRECEIGTCLHQGELYILENNECRLICDEYSDETGRRYWDSSRNKCMHDCAPGFKEW